MSISIGSFSTNSLSAQPFGYEGEARTGLTARTFRMSGLLTPTEWQTLVAEYNSWRNSRIQDEDTLKSGVVGTTISVTVTSANGISVSNLPCWFVDPPQGEQTGYYVSASAVLVDAAQALQVLLRQKEKERQQSEADVPSLGTITLGSVVVTLTKPASTRRDIPAVALTASGVSYITGPLTAHKVLDVQGYISTGTYSELLAWFDSTIQAAPALGAYFPVTAPVADAEVVVSEGVKSTRYNVTLALLQIR